MIKLLISSL